MVGIEMNLSIRTVYLVEKGQPFYAGIHNICLVTIYYLKIYIDSFIACIVTEALHRSDRVGAIGL
jgi:hypothetical protein